MAQGIEVFNADGSLQFSTASRLLRTLLDIDTGTANGSATVQMAGAGSIVLAQEAASDIKQPPTVSQSGNTVSWDFSATAVVDRQSAKIKVYAF